jgi:hypothetical protein
MLVSIDSRRAFLKMVEDWIIKGFMTCPFKEPPLSDLRVHDMIVIIKGTRLNNFFSVTTLLYIYAVFDLCQDISYSYLICIKKINFNLVE